MKTRIFIALNAVLITLVAAIAVQCIFFGRDVAQTGAEAVPLPLDRSAFLNASESVYYSNIFGSSSDESLTGVFSANDSIFLFGRTGGNDLDCAELGSDSFMVRLDDELKITGAYPVDDGLAAVTYGEGGFICAAQIGDETTLSVYSYDGEKLRSRKAYVPGGVGEPVLSLTSDGYALIRTVKRSWADKPYLFVTLYDFFLNVRAELTLTATRALSPIACFAQGERLLLFCSATNDLGQCVALFTVDGDNASVAVYICENSDYECFQALPTPCGWALLCSTSNSSGVRLLSHGLDDLGFTALSASAQSGHVEFIGGRYYLSLGDELFACDESFSAVKKLSGSGKLLSSVSLDGGGLYSRLCGDGLTVTGTDGVGERRIAGALSGGKLIVLGDCYYVVALSDKTGGEVMRGFGGTDIFIARLKV